MSKGNLCIGGPKDGQWHRDVGAFFIVTVAKRGNQGIRGKQSPDPSEATSDRIRYNREIIHIDRNVIAVWLVEGMSFYDATLRLLENYKPVDKV